MKLAAKEFFVYVTKVLLVADFSWADDDMFLKSFSLLLHLFKKSTFYEATDMTLTHEGFFFKYVIDYWVFIFVPVGKVQGSN